MTMSQDQLEDISAVAAAMVDACRTAAENAKLTQDAIEETRKAQRLHVLEARLDAYGRAHLADLLQNR